MSLQKYLHLFSLALFLMLPNSQAFADNKEIVVKEITDTADRICGTVASAGSTHDNNVKGQISADVNALSKKVAELGFSVAADTKSKEYSGLQQGDLLEALKDQRECKKYVLDVLLKSFSLAAPQAALPQKMGELVFTAERAAIKLVSPVNSVGKATVSALLSFSVLNKGNRPISIAFAEDYYHLQIVYDDATAITSNGCQCTFSGIKFCDKALGQCKVLQPTPFTEIAPNSAPAHINLTFVKEVQATELQTMSSIKTGSFSANIWAYDGEDGKQLPMSLPNFPVQNSIPAVMQK